MDPAQMTRPLRSQPREDILLDAKRNKRRRGSQPLRHHLRDLLVGQRSYVGNVYRGLRLLRKPLALRLRNRFTENTLDAHSYELFWPG